MTQPDPLDILRRRIGDFAVSSESVQAVLIPRLYRLAEPVLEEREHLLSKLERGDRVLWNQHPYEPGSLRPDLDDPAYQGKVDRWIGWLSRLEAIETVLASFPDSGGDLSSRVSHENASGTPLTQRSMTLSGLPP